MNRLATVFALCALVSATSAQTTATCQDPDGYSYYHDSGVVPKGSSSFSQDKITGGYVYPHQPASN
jgi:phosphate-selective porin